MVTVFFDSLNAYTDLGLFMTGVERSEPVPKRTLVKVPCKDGLLDLSHALSSDLHYENRQLRLTFKYVDYCNDWENTFSCISNRLHGKQMHVVFSSDQEWYYDAFVTVDQESEFNVGTIEVNCDCYPYKRRPVVLQVTATQAGEDVIALVTKQTVNPEITCESSVVIETNSAVYGFPAGTHTDPAFRLAAGSHVLTVKGSGAVTITYKDGKF